MAYIEYVHIRPRSDVLLAGLASGLGFNGAELKSNRAGLIHKVQMERIIKIELAMKLIGIGMTLLMGLAFRLSWLIAVEKRSLLTFLWRTLFEPTHFLNQVQGGMEEPLPVIVQVILLVFPVLVISQLCKLQWTLILDVLAGKTERATGPVSARWEEKRLRGKKGREGDLVSTYVYTIKGTNYEVTRAGYEAMISTVDYSVYYLPRTKRVMSAEPVDTTTCEVKDTPNGIQLVRAAQTDLFI